MTIPATPVLVIDPPESGAGSHSYYDKLTRLPDLFVAYPFRPQSEIDKLPEASSSSDVKQPIVYDPIDDSGRFTIDAKVSFDVKGRYMPFRISTGSFFLTWDFKLHENFRYKPNAEYIQKHKAWRFNPGPIWLAVKTFYSKPSQDGQFGEFIVTAPSSKYLTPNSWRGARLLPDGSREKTFPSHWYGEGLAPRVGEFYFKPNTWTRPWLFVEGLDQPTCFISAWCADEQQDAVQILDRLEYRPLPQTNPLATFQVEFDTSGDFPRQGLETNHVTYGWTRNYVTLKDISLADAKALLEKPH